MAKDVELGLKITPHLDISGGGLKADISKAEAMLSALEDIEIGGVDTSAGEAELQSLMAAAEAMAEALGAVEDEIGKFEKSLGDIDGSSLESLAAEYDKITAEIKSTLDIQEKARKQLKATGQDGTQAYKDLEAEISATKDELKKFEAEAEKSSGVLEFQNALDSLQQLGSQLGELEENNREYIASQRQMAAVTGLTGAALDDLKARAEGAFKRGVGESLAEATRAITTAQQQLGKFLNPAELEDFTVKAAGIGRAFDKDVVDVIGGSRTLIQNFGLKGSEAADLISLGMRDAGSKMDDLLDTTDEYSQIVKQAGFSAEEFIGSLTKGVQLGARDTDKLADSIKEAQIRLKAGDTSKALADIAGPVSATIQGIVKAGEQGTLSVKEVIQKSASAVEEAFNAGQISEAMRTQLQVAVAGTPAEDIGSDLYGKVFGAPIDIAQIKAKAKEAGAAVTSEAPKGFLGSIGAELEVFKSKAAATFAPVINGAGGVLTAVSGIGPGLVLLQDKFKIFDVAGGFFKALIPKILGTIVPLGAQAVATEGATAAQIGLNASMLLNPIFLIIAGLAAGVAAFLIFSSKTKDLTEATNDLNAALETSNAAFQNKTDTAKQAGDVKKLADEYDRLKTSTDPAGIKRFEEVGAELAKTYPEATESLNKFDAAGNIVGDTFVVATDQVRAFAKEKQTLADSEAADALAVLQDEALALVDSYRESTDNLADLKDQRAALNRLESGTADIGDQINERLRQSIPLASSVKDKQKDVNKEIAEESKKRKESEVALRKGVAAMIQQGKSAKEIGVALGLSVEEVSKLSGGALNADGSIKKAAASAGGLERNTKGAATSAQQLAEAYAKVKANADAAFNNSFGAVLALKQELRRLPGEIKRLNDAKAAGLPYDQKQLDLAELRLKQLPGLIAAEKEAARQAVRDKKALADEEARLNLEIGAVDPNVTDFGPQIRALRQELKGLNLDLGLTFNEDELAGQIANIKQTTDEAIAQIGEQIRAVREQRAKGGIGDQFKGVEEFIGLLTKKQIALGKQRDADILKAQREAAKARLEALKGNLGVQLAGIDEALALRLQHLSTQIDEVEGDSDLALATQLFLRLEAISTGKEKELLALLGEDEKYITAYAALQKTLKDIDEATRAGRVQSEIDTLTATARLQEEALDAEEERIRSSGIRQQAIRDNYAAQERKARAEFAAATYQAELAAIDRVGAASLKAFLKEARYATVIVEDLAEFADTFGEEVIEAKLKTRLDLLQEQRDGELVSAEKFEADKLSLEEKAERERTALQARSAAIREVAANAAATRELEIQAETIRQKLALAEQKGDAAGAEAFTVQLDDLKEQIEEKGSLIAFAGDKAGEAITQSLTGLFQGDEEQVKAPFRSLFQTLGGALQTLASAKITEVLLGLIGPVGGLPGFFLTLGLRPVISGLVGAVMAPILNSLLSFSTGGRVDSPTLAIVGDASRASGGAGSSDREWIFRDDQLRALVGAVAGSMALRSEQIADSVRAGIRAGLEEVEFRLEGTAIIGAVRRVEASERGRILRFGVG